MTPLSLLVVCVGLSCTVKEESASYMKIANEEYAISVLEILRAARARLEGFNNWYEITANQTITELQTSLHNYVNPPLVEIQSMMENTAYDSQQGSKCLNIALVKLKEKATATLPQIVTCIRQLKTHADAVMQETSQKLNEMVDLEKRMKEIVPECEAERTPSTCIQFRTNHVVIAVNLYAEYSRNSAEQETANFFDKRVQAMSCQQRHLNKIKEDGDNIRQQAYRCIKNS